MKNTTRNIVLSGLLIALSIVLTRIFSQQMMVAGVPASRLSIGFVPVMLAGIISGPFYGLAVGALADSIGFLLFPSGVYFLPITLTSALVGLLPGLIVRYTGKTPDWAKVLISVVAVQIICSAFLQTWFLSMLFIKEFMILFVPRAIVALVMMPVDFLLLFFILEALKRARLIPSRLGGAT